MAGPLQVLSHFGHVVTDLDSSMEEYARAFGLAWAAVQEVSVRVRDRMGIVRDVEIAYVSSLDPPVHLELISEVAGSVWTRCERHPFHHVAYWVDDLDVEAARLRSVGFRLEATGDGDHDLNDFAYFRGPNGLLVEPKPEASRAANEHWLAAGRSSDGAAATSLERDASAPVAADG